MTATPEIKYRLTYRSRRRQALYYPENLGDRIRLNMVQIPGGSFLMGSLDELDRNDDEGPQHEVTVSGFYMGMYPVTQEQWRQVARFEQVERELDPDPSYFEGDNRPVEQVSWYDAIEFCARLSKVCGRNYRLPSEAEWEYACRAGSQTPFHFGPTITTDLANYDGDFTYGSGPEGQCREETTEVGSFGVANSFGLYDMHGNVWEWCQDSWHKDYTNAPDSAIVWEGGDSDYKVLRGGSWVGDPRLCRSACRNRYSPESRGNGIGFRVSF